MENPTKKRKIDEKSSSSSSNIIETEAFVWKKKEQLKPEDKTPQQRKAIAEDEIKKLRESRMKSYYEQIEKDEERARREKDKYKEQFGDLETEDEFNLNQFFMSSEFRFKNKKYRQVDVILSNFLVLEKQKRYAVEKGKKAKTIHNLVYDEIPYDPTMFPNLDSKYTHPAEVIKRITSQEKMLELHADVVNILTMDKKQETRKFWESVLILCENQMQKGDAHAHVGVHPQVQGDVDSTLQEHSIEELEALEIDVHAKLSHPDETVDVDYWTSISKCIKISKAHAYINMFHDSILKAHEFFKNEINSKKTHKTPIPKIVENPQIPDTLDQDYTEDEIVAEGDDGLLEDENADFFNDEVDLENFVIESQNPTGSLLKPRYYNRIHTGFEWSKHNKMYYDPENPPPKVVQGYKFNIFYPDLKDKTKPPHYVIENDAQDKSNSTCLLKFVAGAPYQDIAFRIVKREWDKSHRRGFKCVFERGVLRLFFRFKKYRYRR